jgi:ketosteroid isomerase-like protein
VARQYQLTLNTLFQGAWGILLSRYSGESDVVFGATVSGHDALLQMIQQDIDSDTINAVVSFETVDVFAGGEFVTETGKGISKDSDGNVLKTSKYMAIFEKRNGKYICIRDIYNEDKK